MGLPWLDFRNPKPFWAVPVHFVGDNKSPSGFDKTQLNLLQIPTMWPALAFPGSYFREVIRLTQLCNLPTLWHSPFSASHSVAEQGRHAELHPFSEVLGENLLKAEIKSLPESQGWLSSCCFFQRMLLSITVASPSSGIYKSLLISSSVLLPKHVSIFTVIPI